MIVMLRGAIKKMFFVNISRKGGVSLTEKNEIFLDFFAKRGGVLTQSKRVLAENWAKYPKIAKTVFF